MLFRQLFDRPTSSFTYLLADEETRAAVLIDPVQEQIERDLQLLRELGLELRYVLDTHTHADHITGAGALRERTGAKTGASAKGPDCADVHIADADVIEVGALALKAMATPGHSDCSMSYLVGDRVFTGDTLLVRGCGRTDFQNGNARELYASITSRLFTLPDATLVYPGHDYRGHAVSTIGEEKRHNPRLAGKTEDEFVALMSGLALAPPVRLLESVAANRACGNPSPVRDLTVAEANGRRGTARFIDVREGNELVGELGHIAGIEHVALGTLPDAAAAWPREETIVIVCRSGNRSGKATRTLMDVGFRDVFNMGGGMIAWNAASLPVTRER